ncbi:hypothetical protein [Helicobacter sp. MIT 05-5294]|uniref:hypothetical protein n=1 Tax=Helicobacter sp. MIT 05-5294 TaxID=1548150 RepID=UPI0010FDAF0C|nr:hypothetical protein [Helicobacter sp. MIT 05-5294]TLD86494.1 hypothetical protein LS69_005695 [Helicobacter sp. MIT 05-5294]
MLTSIKKLWNENISAKEFMSIGLLGALVIVGIVCVLLYLYDPMQIFHKPYFRKLTFHQDMRIQAKGIIKHYDFDSYIIGTSMLENTSAKEAGEKLDGKWVNISLSGSIFEERSVILEYLFANKSPKSIIYTLEPYAMSDKIIENKEAIKRTAKVSYLYDDTEIDDIKTYMNYKFISCAFSWSNSKKCIGESDDLETLLQWGLRDEYKRLFGGFENWIEYSRDDKGFELLNLEGKITHWDFVGGVEVDKQKQNLTKTLLRFIDKNPNTRFYLIIPTYSRFFWRFNIQNEKGVFADVLFYQNKEVFQWFVNELEKYPNATLYGFDTLDYADNIANYKDSTHYNTDMNSMQLDAIANKTHIITPQNVESYFEIMKQKILDYDVKSLVESVKEFLK